MDYIFHLGTRFDEDKGVQFPVLVSHVCKSWRRRALNAKTLWTSIDIKIDKASVLAPDCLFGKASAFALRSRRSPLHFRMKVDCPDFHLLPPSNQCAITSLIRSGIKFIAVEQERVKTLKVITDVESVCDLITSGLIPGSLPLLEKWHVSYGKEDVCFGARQGVPNRDRAIFHSTIGFPVVQGLAGDTLLPQLREIKLSGADPLFYKWAIGSLTSLTLDCLAPGDRPRIWEFRIALMLSGNSLETLKLRGSLPVRWNVEQMPPIVLPKLRQLRLGFAVQEEALDFLLVLQMPSLNSLDLCDLTRTENAIRCRALEHAGYSRDLPGLISIPDLEPNYHFDSAFMLHSVCTQRPTLMAQIESLTLTNLRLLHTAQEWGPDVLTDSIAPPHILPVRLMLTMKSLKTLVLDDPDYVFLQSLNQRVLISGSERNAKPSYTYPGSQISSLVLVNTKYSHLMEFLNDRTAIARHLARHPEFSETLPVFDRLDFTLEAGDVGACTKEFRAGRVEGPTIAKTTYYVCSGSPLHPAVYRSDTGFFVPSSFPHHFALA
ncbi:hypothetical protein HYDPIDRAFT_116944 [Hydnomerulius pinastri MD-312]|uniref:F-box domain-containing protein n=1 Tax=Hydnomerulius pinastri MD-312 TaxID=994086 RepID=A0A0C9VS38_9AGAM|nr:hypothetical protein HYDPIDRAFT_116944 [Hydnomerulius pinastri MD-312]